MFITLMDPSNTESGSSGVITVARMVREPSSGVNPVPESGVNDQVPQDIDEASMVQFKSDSLSPIFCIWKFPATVAPGLISVQERLPEQSRFGVVSF